MLKEGLGYQIKPEITRTKEEAEQELLKNGWKQIMPGLWMDEKSPERGDAYALLQRKSLGL